MVYEVNVKILVEAPSRWDIFQKFATEVETNMGVANVLVESVSEAIPEDDFDDQEVYDLNSPLYA